MNENTLSVEELHKELELVQSCITRMANNSFSLKGWLIVLLVAAIALAPEQINKTLLLLITTSATICLWYLDAYYLKQERLFRWKYEWIIRHRSSCEDKKDNRKFLYDLNPNNADMWDLTLTKQAMKRKKIDKNYVPVESDYIERKAQSVIEIMFTVSMVPMYLFVIIISVVLVICFH